MAVQGVSHRKKVFPQTLPIELSICDMRHELRQKGGTVRSRNVVIASYT